MRIAVVSTMAESPWGGSEELWGQMVARALGEGHEVLALVPRWSPRAQAVTRLEGRGLVVAEWERKGTNRDSNLRSGLNDLYPYHSLAEFQPEVICISHGGLMDVVHGHLLLVEYLLTSQVPFVVVIQANTELYQPDDQQRQILKSYFQCARRVLFVSQANYQLAKRQLASPIMNGSVINNPVNLSDHSPVTWPADDTPRLACVARFDTVCKAQDVLFEVFGKPKWLERQWTLSLFGKGKHERYLRDLAKYFNIDSRIHWKYVDDVRKIWEDHHLLVLPSRVEGTPLVLMEAMLCGRPSVVADAGGNYEWVRDSQEGYLAQSSSPRHIDQALEKAWQSFDQWRMLGKNARSFFLKNHDPKPDETLLACIIRATLPRSASILKKKPLISIVVPCYNQAEFLDECIDSIQNQTYENWECIIVNDGSTDNTLDIAKKYSTCNKKIKIINKENGGVAQARNFGMRKSSGEWIVPLDSDDALHESFLDCFVGTALKNEKINIITCCLQEFGQSSNIGIPGVYSSKMILNHNTFINSSMFKRRLFNLSGGYYEGLPWQLEDWNFWIELSKYKLYACKINKPLMLYRVRKNSAFDELNKYFHEARAFLVTIHAELYSKEKILEAIHIINSMSTETYERIKRISMNKKNLVMPIVWKKICDNESLKDIFFKNKYEDFKIAEKFFLNLKRYNIL